MNKLSIKLILVLGFFLIFTSCEMDNYDGPNASLSGGIIDEKTNELVGTDLMNGSTIRAYEQGWTTESAQTWVIKNTGEYRNDMVFAATYRLEFVDGNFYPFTVDDFKISTGKNTHDFKVTPYIRVLNPSITHDAASNKIVATFSIEGGKPEVAVNSIRLYAFTDMHVGHQVKFDLDGDGFKQDFSPATAIDGTKYTLTIDLNLEKNQSLFKYSRNYYFRIGALAYVPDVGTIRHNYSPLVVIKL